MNSEKEMRKRPDDIARPPYGHRQTDREKAIEAVDWVDARESGLYQDSVLVDGENGGFNSGAWMASDTIYADPDAGGNEFDINIIRVGDDDE